MCDLLAWLAPKSKGRHNGLMPPACYEATTTRNTEALVAEAGYPTLFCCSIGIPSVQAGFEHHCRARVGRAAADLESIQTGNASARARRL